jgi:chaperonin GroES
VVSEDGRLPIKMLHDRVLVRVPREEGERRSTGGILIPSTAQVATRLMWAEALAVGNHVRTVEAGDRVLFSPEDRQEVEVHAEVYVILRERDIHAIAARRIEPATGLYL